MAKDKKGFILYCDIIHTVLELDDNEAGQLFKHILKYVNDLNPQTDNKIVKIAFEPIKQNLKRDLQKYENIRENKRKAGKKGAEKRWQKIADDSTAILPMAKIAVKDKVKVKDIYRSFAHLSITVDEYKKLCEEYGKENTEDIIDQIQNYKQNTKYKSLYLTAKNWLKKLPKNEQEDKLVTQAKKYGYVK